VGGLGSGPLGPSIRPCYCMKPKVSVAIVGDINKMTEEALVTQNAEIQRSWVLKTAIYMCVSASPDMSRIRLSAISRYIVF
jgi:hypothetical protein